MVIHRLPLKKYSFVNHHSLIVNFQLYIPDFSRGLPGKQTKWFGELNFGT
jgi:hypothetical protein